MRLSSRARQLQHAEVANVRRALDEAQAAVDAAAKAQEDYFSAAPERDMFGTKKDTQEPPPDAASWNIKELRYAFKAVRDALEAWLAHGDDAFVPAVIAWDDDGGDDALQAVQAALTERQQLAEVVSTKVPPLRSQVTFVAPVRGPIANLLGAVELVQRTDDIELVPAILSGQRETSSQATADRADRYRTSDDVARSLRMARPTDIEAMPPPEPEAKGLFGRLTAFLKRDS